MNSRKRQPSLTQTWSTSKKASNLIGSTEQPDVDPQQTTSGLRSDTEDVSSPQNVSIGWEVDTPLQAEKEMLQYIGEDQPDVDPQQTTPRLNWIQKILLLHRMSPVIERG